MLELFKRFRRKDAGYSISPADRRWITIVLLVKDLNKTHYDKLKETMDLIWEAYGKCKNIKSPDEIVDEAGGFLLHEKDGVVK